MCCCSVMKAVLQYINSIFSCHFLRDFNVSSALRPFKHTNRSCLPFQLSTDGFSQDSQPLIHQPFHTFSDSQKSFHWCLTDLLMFKRRAWKHIILETWCFSFNDWMLCLRKYEITWNLTLIVPDCFLDKNEKISPGAFTFLIAQVTHSYLSLLFSVFSTC